MEWMRQFPKITYLCTLKKNRNMRNFCLVIGMLTCLIFSASAQKKGYNIRITDEGLNGKYFFVGFYGEESFVLDSAVAKNNTLVFKGRKFLNNGYYRIIGQNESTGMPLIIERSRKFEMDFLTSPPLIPNENRIYRDYLLSDVEPRAFVRSITSADPNALVSKYMLLETFGHDTLLPDDGDLLRHPHYDEITWPKLENADATTLNDFFYHHNTNREIGRYYLGRKILQLWNTEQDNDLLVFLYDKYYSPELNLFDEEHDRLIRKHVERARRVLIGAKMPPMTAYDAQAKPESTNNIHRAYTVIWFWDPDCDDCMIETPQLHQFYLENADKYDFEVFAVSITDDTDRWKKTCKEMGLSWINTCYAMGEPNYDFINYFNILTTPGSFLIDKDHKIIMRSFSLDELQDFFQKTYKNSEE